MLLNLSAARSVVMHFLPTAVVSAIATGMVGLLSLTAYLYAQWHSFDVDRVPFEWSDHASAADGFFDATDSDAPLVGAAARDLPHFPSEYIEVLNHLEPYTVESERGYGEGYPGSARIISIGIDGATWKVLNPLLERGLLPNFERLLKRSTYGNLQTDEAFSPVSWTSIATGKSRESAFYQTELSDLWESRETVVRVKRFWNMLAEPGGKGLALVNYYFQPGRKKYPKAILVDNRSGFPWMENRLGNLGLKKAWIQFSSTTTAARQILANEDVSIFASIESESDIKQHAALLYFLMSFNKEFQRFSPASNAISREQEESAQDIVQVYLQNDRLIGQILDDYPNDYLFVVSDHGFQAMPPVLQLDLPYLLYGNGRNEFFRVHDFPDFGGPGNAETEWVFNHHRFEVEQRMKKHAWKFFQDKQTGETLYLTAYIGNYYFKCPNPDARSALMTYLAEFLSESEQGRIAFRITEKGDIVAIRTNTDFIDTLIDSLELINTHTPEDPGVFMITGPGIAKGKIAEASLFDITPTLLYLKGKPNAGDMEGKVIFDAIDPEFAATHRQAIIDSYEDEPALPQEGKHKLTKIKKKQLQSLGYL